MPNAVDNINKTKRLSELLVAFTVLAFCEVFFFRNIIGTGALIGDNGDGRLTALLAEHWWSYFNGKERFTEIAMFYPCKEVIGYTDLLLGYGVIHSMFRMIGFDIYLSYKYTMIVTHIIGTVSMYYLLKDKLHCSMIWSLFGTIAFCFSNAYAYHLGHTQLNAISFLPVLLILIIGFVRNLNSTYKRNAYAFMTITWFAMITYNSWYVACFTGLFCLILMIVFFFTLYIKRISFVSTLKKIFLYLWKWILLYIAYTVVVYCPFLQIYMPVMSKGVYSYEQTTVYMPELIDLINVTDNNFALGWLIKLIGLPDRGYSMEVSEGFSIVLLMSFLAAIIITFKRDYRKEGGKAAFFDKTINQNFIESVFISILICIIIVVRFTPEGGSLWSIVYRVVPVVRSTRAVARFWLWLSFPLSVITAYTLSRQYGKTIAQGYKKMIPICLVVLLFISNISLVGVSSFWNIKNEEAFLSHIQKPPKEAEAFYIINAENKGYGSPYYQLDAFDIATKYSIKTINGYSGRNPEGWDGVSDIYSDLYEGYVITWINNNRIKNVYAYDIRNNEWIPFEARANTH